MKNKKGFTLIELLAVIVVLAIIMVIATINVNKQIKKSRENANDINKKAIKKAVDVCMVQENDITKCNTVSKLIKAGYLEEFEDPLDSNNNDLDSKYIITIDESNVYVDYVNMNDTSELEKYFVWSNTLVDNKYNGEKTAVTGLTNEGLNYFKRLGYLTFPKKATQIRGFSNSNYCKYVSSTKKVIIPSNISLVDNNAFSNCNITDVVIAKGVKRIVYMAFANNKLSEINIPETTQVRQGAFNHNLVSGNKAFIIGMLNGQKTLLSYAGNDTSVVIPNDVTAIGDNALDKCNLTSVTLNDNLKSIGLSSFAGNKLTSLKLPNSIERIDGHAFLDNNISSISYKDGTSFDVNKFKTPYLVANDLCNEKDKFTISGNTIYGFNCKKPGKIVIPQNITEIGHSAFRGIDVSNIDFGSSKVRKLYANSFLTSIEEFALPSSVEEIARKTFLSSIKKVYVKKGSSSVIATLNEDIKAGYYKNLQIVEY